MQDVDGAGKGEVFEFNCNQKEAYLCWDASGGSSTPRIRLYGSIFPSIINPTESTATIADWEELFSVASVPVDSSGQTLISHIYPKMWVRITANSGSSRVRVWVAYDGE